MRTRLNSFLTEVDNFDSISNFPAASYHQPSLTKFVADSGAGLILDSVLGFTFQLYEDSFDPRFSNTQRAGRATVAGVGSGATGLAVAFVGVSICGTTPLCIGAGIVAGVGAGFGFDTFAKPRIFQRFGLDPVDSLIQYNP